MALIDDHVHDTAPSAWPFAEPTNTQAFSNARVVHVKRPVLLVVHDDEGDWLFLCGSEDLGEALIVCLACAYQHNPDVGAVADLPVGWRAWRESVNHPWQMEPDD